jgi:hypothetical protein
MNCAQVWSEHGRKGDCLEDLHIDERITLKNRVGGCMWTGFVLHRTVVSVGDFVNIVRNAGNLESLLHGDSIRNPDFGSVQMHKYLRLLYGEDEMNMAMF